MSGKPNKEIHKRGILHRFYFIEPRENADAEALAEKLISLKTVEEVFLTDGDYGFVVKTRFLKGREPDDITDYISKNVSKKFGKVVSYYKYRK